MNHSKIYKVFSIICLLILFVAVIFFRNPYTSDAKLEKRFFENKADFENLVRLFQSDSNLEKISIKDGAWLDYDTKIKISQNRMNLYYDLLKKLDVEEIRRNKPDEDIYLQVYRTSNLIIGRKTKYYFFTKSEPEIVVESLDRIYGSGQDANAYKKLEKNWYLYLDVW